MDAHDRRLVAVAPGVGVGSAECLGPVGRESLAVLGVEAVAEGVADDLVDHHPCVPGLGQPEEALVAAGGLIDARHEAITADGGSVLGGRAGVVAMVRLGGDRERAEGAVLPERDGYIAGVPCWVDTS